MIILNKIWFNEMGSINPIGIVIIQNEIGEEKAYIGTGGSHSEDDDVKKIAERGAKFPINIAKLLMSY